MSWARNRSIVVVDGTNLPAVRICIIEENDSKLAY